MPIEQMRLLNFGGNTSAESCNGRESNPVADTKIGMKNISLQASLISQMSWYRAKRAVGIKAAAFIRDDITIIGFLPHDSKIRGPKTIRDRTAKVTIVAAMEGSIFVPILTITSCSNTTKTEMPLKNLPRYKIAQMMRAFRVVEGSAKKGVYCKDVKLFVTTFEPSH